MLKRYDIFKCGKWIQQKWARTSTIIVKTSLSDFFQQFRKSQQKYFCRIGCTRVSNWFLWVIFPRISLFYEARSASPNFSTRSPNPDTKYRTPITRPRIPDFHQFSPDFYQIFWKNGWRTDWPDGQRMDQKWKTPHFDWFFEPNPSNTTTRPLLCCIAIILRLIAMY